MTKISRQQVVTAVSLQACIQQMCSSDLGQDASYPDLDLLWYSSVLPRHMSEQYNKQIVTVSFQILYSSLFTILPFNITQSGIHMIK